MTLKTHFSGGHFEIQYGSVYHGNLGGYLTLNDIKKHILVVAIFKFNMALVTMATWVGTLLQMILHGPEYYRANFYIYIFN